MKFIIGVCITIASLILVEGQQRVAPGVPPQQYQQQYAPPPPPQQHQQMQPPQQQMPNQVPQMQQQQVQYQQVPMQQQQIPQQQVPQQHIPVQQQQVPVHPQQGGHPQGGHGHGHQQQLLNSANIMQEKQHIAEHADIPIDVSKMSEQELQFHYFKMHDADRNDKLDGCELIKSLIHWHEQGHKDPNNPSANQVQEKIFSDDELVALIDPIMKMDDTNGDGFIDYPEFVRAQNKAAAEGQRT